MQFDGVLSDIHPGRDLPCRQSLPEECENLELTRRQLFNMVQRHLYSQLGLRFSAVHRGHPIPLGCQMHTSGQLA